MNNLRIIPDTRRETQLIERYITATAAPGAPIRILEAGCGQSWVMQLNNIAYTLTGIDLDKDAIALRQQRFNDLDEVIIGDLRTVELEAEQFDVIYNAFVLEHVENATQVLENFTRWLKPDGIMILKIPDRYSVYGFLARHTPHWLHVSYYKYIKGCKSAGAPGHMPYPTVYDKNVSSAGIRKFCRQHNLEIKQELGKNNYLRGVSVRNQVVKLGSILLSIVSLGYLAWKHNDLIYIIQKPGRAVVPIAPAGGGKM